MKYLYIDLKVHDIAEKLQSWR